MAAGSLILTEAGGQLSDFSGKPNPKPEELVATNGLIHDELVAILTTVKSKT